MFTPHNLIQSHAKISVHVQTAIFLHLDEAYDEHPNRRNLNLYCLFHMSSWKGNSCSEQVQEHHAEEFGMPLGWRSPMFVMVFARLTGWNLIKLAILLASSKWRW